jgi:DMSO/TMAO reductase YedYZ heme-binding membrane subunit
MTRRTWKRLHYTAYAAAILFYVHGLLSDPTVNDRRTAGTPAVTPR